MTEQIFHLNSSLSDASFTLSCENILSKLVRPDQAIIDWILKHDTRDKAEIVLPDGQKFLWYFAIGSMINPVSLFLRDIIPLISYPAKCPDHKIVFRASGGMADIEHYSGSELHGVVHLLSDEQMSRLDAIELSYHRIVTDSINYQEQNHLVYIYKMNIDNQSTGLPSERYIDIIVKGCEYYKVQPEYINQLKYEQAVIPRKQPHTLQSFTIMPDNLLYSEEELARHDGTDPTLPLWISVNGKLLEYSGLPPIDHPEYELQKRLYEFIKSKLGGREVTYVLARTLYEPLYKIPMHENDLSIEHRALIEDDFYCKINNGQSYWKLIGRLRVSNSPL
ncbi:unnamed protein product [Rotaria socialis]|uniref:gamma-glutamylcyclotransferase n=2 Tax=Rotaria socialis TaxID=392032 RepID=A0A821Q3W1_9BILA|nr:unnamed protein product [Rotaria socialis]CAF3404280.1 unnamed protein product [Rotaria socialis]CAF3631725.1 unnamed protein product [Rotaria socialis]CAF3652538.1 unnamed protein product [Rotaria socialis]CAF3809540.1 unnamed protein product [Rotaria socialis]